DLFFSVRIETMLKREGYAVRVLGKGEEALAQAERHTPALVIVNFGSDRLTPADFVRRLKSLPAPPPVLGFVPHKWLPQVRPAALAAGSDLLVATSALVRRLPQLAENLAPRDGAPIRLQEATELADDEEE